MTRFLITGLPRSRTAWWAVATGAQHEPISREGWATFQHRWEDGTGVADASALLHLAEIMDEFSPRTLIIHREPNEVVESFCRYAGVSNRSEVRAAIANFELELNFTHPLVKHVAYSHLSDGQTVAQCFGFLGVKPPKLLGQLMHMRIESDLAWNLAELVKIGAA